MKDVLKKNKSWISSFLSQAFLREMMASDRAVRYSVLHVLHLPTSITEPISSAICARAVV